MTATRGPLTGVLCDGLSLFWFVNEGFEDEDVWDV